MAKSKLIAPQTIKRFTSVHSWVGIVSGMALFIAFYAGAFTMYASPMRLWANAEVRQSSGTMNDVQALIDKVAADPSSGGSFSINFADGGRPVATYYESGAHGYTTHVRVLDEQARVEPRRSPSDIASFINLIHATLGIPGNPGYLLMGVVSALYFLALVTGLIIHLPHLLRDLYALRVGKNLKKMWLDAHNAIGILSLPFHLMFALTGFLICIVFQLPGVMEKITPTSAPSAAYSSGGTYGSEEQAAEDTPARPARMAVPPAQLVAIARARIRDLEPHEISYSSYGTDRASATVTGRVREALISYGSVEISPVTGAIGTVSAPGERSTARVLEDGYLYLHYGEYGGEVMRALYFVLGLGGAFLFFSGNLLWIETKRKRRHAEQPMTGWVLAQLTVGVCIGCCLGIAAALWGTRLLPVDLANRGEWEGNLYFIAFFASVIWAAARPPIRAAIELLIATAVAYAALPLLNALLTRENLLYSLQNGLFEVALIDTILLALGMGFLLLARATARRARDGQPNSVWSLTSRPERRNAHAAPQPMSA